MSRSSVALGHDYLTQRGGAERVALILADAFPAAPLYTSLYDPAGTFPEFASIDVRVSALNWLTPLRSRHRLALPLLAPAIASMRIDADVLLTSSSGWAHGLPTTGRKVVYCHAPARWLYQSARYLGASRNEDVGRRLIRLPATLGLRLLRNRLRKWDRRAALSADRYLANSTVTRDAIRRIYGIDAEVLPPPPALIPGGPEEAVAGVEPGFVLCVARLLPYKNVDVVIEAARLVPGTRLVIVGGGPERNRLAALAAGSDSILLGRVGDAQLSWLYRNCSALVGASYEDYGLSPLEAAAFGRPSVVLRDGGYLDTVVADETGVFFDTPTAESVAAGLRAVAARTWDADALRTHAAKFARPRFEARLREIVAEESELFSTLRASARTTSTFSSSSEPSNGDGSLNRRQ